MRCFGRCFSSSRERNSSGVRRWRGTDNNPRSNLLIFSLRVLCRTVRAQDRSQTWLKRRSFVKKRNVRVGPKRTSVVALHLSAFGCKEDSAQITHLNTSGSYLAILTKESTWREHGAR